jgi:hypothetical protein
VFLIAAVVFVALFGGHDESPVTTEQSPASSVAAHSGQDIRIQVAKVFSMTTAAAWPHGKASSQAPCSRRC